MSRLTNDPLSQAKAVLVSFESTLTWYQCMELICTIKDWLPALISEVELARKK